MQKNTLEARRPNLVMAMFEDGLSTFSLPRGATLELLAGRLASLAEKHQGRAIAFKVRLGAAAC